MASVSDWKAPVLGVAKPEDDRDDLDLALASMVALRNRADRRLHSGDARHRARRQWRRYSQHRPCPHDWISDHRGRRWLAGRWTAARCLGTCLATIRKPDSGWCRRSPRSTCRRSPSASPQALGGERVVVAGAGGRHHSVAARVVAKQEFAGDPEYVLDEAIFTAPAHPNWGGTALIGPGGDLRKWPLTDSGRGDKGPAQKYQEHDGADRSAAADLRRSHECGRRNAPARPWLGFYEPKWKTGWWWSGSPIAARPTCRSAYGRYPARGRRHRGPGSGEPVSAHLGRKAKPASRCRSPFIGTATPWNCT